MRHDSTESPFYLDARWFGSHDWKSEHDRYDLSHAHLHDLFWGIQNDAPLGRLMAAVQSGTTSAYSQHSRLSQSRRAVSW
jgi:hypothetical protein